MIVVLSDKRLGPSDRFCRDTVFFNVFQFRQNSDLGFDRLVGFKINLEITQVAKPVQCRGAAGDQTFLIPYILVENGRSTLTQDGCQNFQSARVVSQNSGDVETQRHVILLDRAALPGVTKPALHGFNRTVIAL